MGAPLPIILFFHFYNHPKNVNLGGTKSTTNEKTFFLDVSNLGSEGGENFAQVRSTSERSLYHTPHIKKTRQRTIYTAVS